MNTTNNFFPGANDTVSVSESPGTPAPEELQEILEAARAQREFEDFHQRTLQYIHSLAKDELGLPVESIGYALSKCKTCWGKGYHTQLVGPVFYRDGETQIVKELTPVYAKSGKVIGTRLYVSCPCQDKGYKKARQKAELEAIAKEKAEG